MNPAAGGGKRRSVRIGFVALAAVPILGLLAVAGLGVWLRSDSGLRLIASQVKTRAAAFGYEVDFAEAKLDPLSFLKAKGLRVRARDGSLDFRVDSLDLQYVLSFFPLRLDIQRAEALRPVLVFKRTAPQLSPEEQRRVQADFESLLARTADFLRRPPVQLTFRDVRVESFSMSIDYRTAATPSLQASLGFPELTLAARGGLTPRELQFEGQLAIPKKGESVIRQQGAQPLEASVAAEGSVKWKFRIHPVADHWAYEVDLPEHVLNLSQLRFRSGAEMEFRAPSLRTRGSIGIAVRSTKLFQLEGQGVDRFEWDTGVSAEPAVLALPKKKFLDLGRQQLAIRGKHSDSAVSMALDYALAHWKSPGVVSSTAPLRIAGNLTLDDALTKLAFGARGSVGLRGSVVTFVADSEVKTAGPLAATGSLELKGGPPPLARLEPRLKWSVRSPGAYQDFPALSRAAAAGNLSEIFFEVRSAVGKDEPLSAEGSFGFKPDLQRIAASWTARTGDYLKPLLPAAVWRQLGTFQTSEARGRLDFNRAGDRLEGSFESELREGGASSAVPPTVKASGELRGTVSRRDFLSQGTVEFRVPDRFPEIAGQKIRGAAVFPWTASVGGGREINLTGDLRLTNFQWEMGGYAARGIHGKLPVSEKLIWDGGKLRFASLLTQNPFERVDYERLRPLLFGADQLRIERLVVEDKTLGPMVGFFSLDQNRFSAHQFDVVLGASGRAYGEMSFDFLPSNLQLAVLTRVTALNLLEVLPERFLKRLSAGDQEISARSGLIVNLARSTIDGRVDVTRIGGTQLMTLINIVDPQYQNERMNLARTALGYGYPTFVGMSFERGFMDLSMDLSLLGASTRYDVRGIPLSSLMASATAELVKTANKGPLQ